ncbi:YgiT-type zinc finger protein [Bdellovibrionota bacterium FG-2]
MHCKGKMKRGTAPYFADRKGYRVSWDSIPAWVCTQCDEPYFEEAEVDRIQEALAVLDKKSASLMKPNRKTSATEHAA